METTPILIRSTNPDTNRIIESSFSTTQAARRFADRILKEEAGFNVVKVYADGIPLTTLIKF